MGDSLNHVLCGKHVGWDPCQAHTVTCVPCLPAALVDPCCPTISNTVAVPPNPNINLNHNTASSELSTAMSTHGETTYGYDENGIKSFIPLENNPDVLQVLARELGVSPQATFQDILSPDFPGFAEHAHAVLVTVPARVYYAVRKDDPELSYDGAGPDEPVMWLRQTSRNTCGSIALLHALCNGSARQFVPAGSELQKIFDEAQPLKPTERAELIYNSKFLDDAHLKASPGGVSDNPGTEARTEHHFMAYIKGDDGHLWELEGGWGGPIDRGELGEGESVLSERAMDMGIKKFLRAAEDYPYFSMVALTDPRPED